MANFTNIVNRLAQHFATIMAEQKPDVKIFWANGRPSTTALDGRSDEWVQFIFRPIEDRAAAIGPVLYRGLGLLEIRVNVPLGKGVGPAQEIHRAIQEGMRESIEGVVVGPATFGTEGEANGWYQTQIRFRITADEATA